MPELPDVEVFRRYLEHHARGRRIRDVHVLNPELLDGIDARQFRERVRGHAVSGTHRHGKYLFMDLGENLHVVLHFGMSGRLQKLAPGETPSRHTRVLFDLDDGALAWVVPRKLARIGLVPSQTALIEAKELGMDALDKRLDFDTFRRLLTGRGTLKCALMNQSLIAGIGNVYSDEILFHAHLDPRRSLATLDGREWRRLHQVMQQVLKEAISRGAEPERLPQEWLLRHRRAGRACGCGGSTAHLNLCGRSAYYCPACQH